ncbi:MAG: dTMP kinase [Candidatus Aureabacteria bacterium]|nr:dTMP kinase [Candidatus Auribacterota bacterium]
MEKRGIFITFEGCEGAGKSTQAQKIYQHLMKNRFSSVLTHEPGGTEVAEKIRALLLDEDLGEPISGRAELLLYFASRAQHVEGFIIPALEKGKIVICDRFYDATVAYQGYGRQIDLATIEMMNSYAGRGIFPDLTILIDIDIRKGIERSKSRNKAKLLKKELNRMERESIEFHQRVREGYLMTAEQNKDRFRVFDGALGESELFEKIRSEVMEFVRR